MQTALDQYESESQIVVKSWLDKIDAANGQPINVSLFALLIAFDNIGRIAYSKDFGTVKSGKETRMLDMAEVTFATIATLGHLDWPLPLFADLKLGKTQLEFEDLAVRLIDERDKVGNAQPYQMCWTDIGPVEI